MQKSKSLTRTLAFFIKGNLTMLEIDATDPRLDSEIIKEFKSRHRYSLKLAKEKARKLKNHAYHSWVPGQTVYPNPPSMQPEKPINLTTE